MPHAHFRLTKELYIEEIKSTLFEYEHLKTKAPVIHLKNDDPENLFALSFPTYPYSSNGLFHVLEHTVLCGSQKYPVKDPFFSMLRRSLATFMNAFTGPDFTCYPASSQIETDFYQLLEVYLDAVFHPLLKKLSFLQEGWRLEFATKDDPSSDLIYKGVVYNEMKGACSSIDERLYHTLMKNLAPDLPYAFDSGGLPEKIPTLTHEELLLAHRKFYHPSRAIFFFYGNLPSAKHLSFLEEHCLKNFSLNPPLPPLPKQKRLDKPIILTQHYPTENPEDKTIFALAQLTCSLKDQKEALALALLDQILFETDASLISRPLLESGLCLEVESSLNLEMSEVPWTIVCKGLEKGQEHKLFSLLKQELHLSKSKITSDLIATALHQLEFSRLEISRQNGPYGLTLFFHSALAKHHGIPLEKGLQIHALFQELSSDLKNPAFLPDLIQKYLLDNPHQVQLTMLPDPKLLQKEAEKEKELLKNIQNNLTPLEKEKIIKQSQELVLLQKENLEKLKCLPLFPIAQIPRPVPDFPLQAATVGNLNIFSHTTFTNQVLYADLVFDLSLLTLEELPFLTLFTTLLTQIGCQQRSYSENLLFISAHLGDFSAYLSLNPQAGSSSKLAPAFALRAKALLKNSPFLFQIFLDMVQTADFSDQKRIKELLLAQISQLKNHLPQNALGYAISEALAATNPFYFLNDRLSGLPYFRFLQRLGEKNRLQNELEKIILKLKELQEKIFAYQPQLVLCSSETPQSPEKQSLENFARHFSKPALQAFVSRPEILLPPEYLPKAKIIPAPVAFNAYALKAPDYLDPDAPFLLLATFLLENLYLHPEIREKGGAYGAGATYANGAFYFFTYRDPNIQRSLEIFKSSLLKITEGGFNQEQLEEAIRGALQESEKPLSPGAKAVCSFFFAKTGKTKIERQKFKDGLLSATKDKIASALNRHLVKQSGFFATFTGRELIEKLPGGLPFETL
ncbi:MAG: insulinase family protein [Parachlamydiales bacterium]|jgi:hypothetical protein